MKGSLIEITLLISSILFKILIIVIPLILSVAYLTYAERRIIGLMQLRKGPNVVGPMGLLQPIADAVKLLFKEIIFPEKADKFIFILAPILTFTLSLIGWSVIPFSSQYVISNINVGVLFLISVSALEVYGVIMSGWASNSKYAFLSAIRASAQMISYELSMGVAIICVLISSGTLNLTEIVELQKVRPLWLELMLAPMSIVFFISVLAETNRHPFDLAEAESELVAGYNVEYSSLSFALFFLGEYANMILVSAITTIFFLGGYLPPFNIVSLNCIPGFVWFIAKISILLFVFIWIRATIPRYRYDQLMRLGWKIFLPLTLVWLVLITAMLLYTGELPNYKEGFA